MKTYAIKPPQFKGNPLCLSNNFTNSAIQKQRKPSLALKCLEIYPTNSAIQKQRKPSMALRCLEISTNSHQPELSSH